MRFYEMSGSKPDRIRALELLASCDNGCPEGILHAHGIAISDMVELVHAGLAPRPPSA